jgi:hypothetical protein
MSTFALTKSRQLFALAMGLAFTASSFAAITSSPTSTVKGTAPTVTNPAVISMTDTDSNGVVNVGDVLQVSWNLASDVSDADGDDVSEATYEWFAGSSSVGTGTELVISAAHLGKSITAKSVAKTDASITDPVESEATLAVLDTSSIPGVGPGDTEIPVVTEGGALSVTIDGQVDGAPKVGQMLTANVVCEGTCSGQTYQWQIESSIGSGSFTNISGGTAKTYTPVKGDQKRQIQVIVNN